MALTTGDTAPSFTLPDHDGEVFNLDDAGGSPVIIFFYPKDNTSGCTTEAKDFSELLPDFEAAGVTVLGISPDSVKSHAGFRRKQDLTVRLLADEDKTVSEAYGVWQEKSMYGRTFMGVVRSTFLIAADGSIAEAWYRVRVPGHAAKVLEAAKALATSG